MANITYNDRTQLLPYNDKKFNAADANEIKRVVNLKADLAQVTAGVTSLGAWNAATNTPALTTTPATIGQFYEVSVAGTQSVTGAAVAYQPNDKLISNGTSWQYIPFANTNGTITIWAAQAYKLGAYVNYVGKDWVAKSVTLASDVPGISPKWQNRLTAYDGLRTIKTVNLLSTATWSLNTILANGSTQAFTNFTTSDYVPVNVGQQYGVYYSSSFTPLPNYRYYWFTSAFVATDPTFSAGDANGLTVAAPANAVYLRISAGAAQANNNMMLVEGATKPTTYVKFGYFLTPTTDSQGFASGEFIKDALATQIAKDAILTGIQAKEAAISPFNTSFLKLGLNRLDSLASDFASGFALDKNTGAISANTAFSVTGFMPVIPGRNYYFSLKGDVKTPLSLSAWYDANKIYISAVTYVNGSTTAPAGAAYIRGCSQIAGFGVTVGYMFIEGDVLPGRFIQFGYDFDTNKIHVNSSLGNWDGKNWIALGDSITWQASYFPTFLSTTGLKNTYNLGEVGALLKTRADTLTSAMIADADIVTVLAGTNDYGHGNTPLGTLADGASVNSFYGNVAYLIEKILALKPTVRLLFFTPTNRGQYATEPNWTPPMANPNGLTMDNISRAIVEKCRAYSVPCLDVFSQSGFNSYTFGTYTVDGLHPNTVGGAKLGVLMGNFVNRINN